MKTFKLFLENTNLSDEEIITTIKVHCKPFLSKIGDPTRNILFRGVRSFGVNTNKFFIKKVHEERRPKDTPLKVHYFLDNYFEKYFGHRFRSQSVFCTPNYVEARKFGEITTIVFPIGEFSSLYFPSIEDMTEEIIDLHDDYKRHYYDKNKKAMTPQQYWSNDFFELLQDHLNDIHANFNEGLNKIANLDTHPEIMISCNEYYSIGQLVGNFQLIKNNILAKL